MNRIATFLLILALSPAACAPLLGQVHPSGDAAMERLHEELVRLEPISGGMVGVAAIHLESGRAAYLNADEAFPMASTYKIPIAVQLLTRVDRGEIALSDMIELDDADLHPGSGTLTRLFNDPGVALSLHNLMELMLLISDNSATDLSLTAAGGGEAVTRRMSELGIEGVRVDRPTSLLISDWAGVDGAPADGRISIDDWVALAQAVDEKAQNEAREAFATDPRDTSTPRGMGKLLQMIWDGEALSPESTALLVDVLERVETGAGRLKGVLPPETTVAHKTGTIGATTNDVGIIYLPGDAGHVVTVVFVKDSEDPVPQREQAIAQIARAVHDFFLFNPGP